MFGVRKLCSQERKLMEKRLILEKVIINDFQGVYDTLKRGEFDPNEPYLNDEVEASILWTRNTERPALGRIVRLLDVAKGKPMEKLLRSFGAKNSSEIQEENRTKEGREALLREENDMKVVDELLSR